MPRRILFFLILSSSSLCLGAQVVLDEVFDSWDDLPGSYWEDPDDVSGSGVDILRSHLAVSEDFIFLYLETEEIFQLQQDNNLELYMDLDGQLGTGRELQGMGIELFFDFGSREGSIYRANGSNIFINHADIGLVTSPTVSGDRFEILIDRRSLFENYGIELGTEVRMVWLHDSFESDRAPNAGFYSRVFEEIEMDLPDDIPPKANDDVRIISYNLLFDNVFESSMTMEAFGRKLRAIEPDIIGIQEIYDHSALEMANMVTELYPPEIGEFWYSARVEPDVIVLSKFPIEEVFSTNGNGLFLLDLGESSLLLANLHLPCCDRDVERQEEIDRFLSSLRDLQNGQGTFILPEGSPMVVLGDMNLVGSEDVQQSLVTGDIANNAAFGPDFNPDWGDGALADPIPRVLGFPGTYTWINPNGSFFPGRLDYILYSSSVLDLRNAFVLDTRELSVATLIANDLESFDSRIVSDHMPVVCDFVLEHSTNSVLSQQPLEELLLSPDNIHLRSREVIESVDIVNISGQLLYQSRPMCREFRWQASNAQPQFLLVRVTTRKGMFVVKWLQ